jgi:hypothetical protein
MCLRDVIGVMSFRIAIRDICRGLYSGLKGAISPGGGVHFEGVLHGMQFRDVIGVMSFHIAIRNICRGLYGGLIVLGFRFPGCHIGLGLFLWLGSGFGFDFSFNLDLCVGYPFCS